MTVNDRQELVDQVAALEAESAALTKALTGLTRQGSEFFMRKGDRFVADIPACVGDVRQRFENAHRLAVNAIHEKKALEEIERLRTALARADGVIEAMSDYIGKMALSADQLSALNEHWLYMQRRAR